VQKKLIWLMAICFSGCTPWDDLNGRSVSMSGAGVVFGNPTKPIKDIDLTHLVNSVGSRISRPNNTRADDHTAKADAASQLVNAIGDFGPPTASNQNEYRYARNQVLGFVIAASNNRCNAFKLALRERSTNITFGLGSLATALGAAGAIFTNGTSQILSGFSGATSGINAEYNRDILSSLTSSVIIPGIDQQRAAILQEIMNRRCLGLESYSLTQALADAVKYHAACSTDVGVAAASSALSQSHSQSLADAQTAIEAVTKMHDTLYASSRSTVSKVPASGTAGAQPLGSNSGSIGTAAATPASASTSTPNGAGQPASKPNPSGQTPAAQTHTTTSQPLLGESLNLLQCPTLSKTGLLPGSPSSTAATTGQVAYGVQ
jgi:hypothetical protein